jgi:hypothetical protein
MKMLKYTLIATLAFASTACGTDIEPVNPGKGGNGDIEPGEQTDYKARAKEMYDIVRPLYLITSGAADGLYREEADGTTQSFLWPFDGWLSCVNELHRLGYDVDYPNEVAKAQRYYTTGAGYPAQIPGYGSSTSGTTGGGTRFYDDNSIIGANLVEAYRVTGDARLLAWCKQIVAFLKTGEDDHLGGAMWWNENQKDPNAAGGDFNKACCSNGYGTNFLLNYHSVCPADEKADVLAFAIRLYDWLYTNLRDPLDNTYWNARQALGAIQNTKWTYNSGIMIKNGLLLYKITGQSKYLDHAKATTTGVYNTFVRMNTTANILAYPNNDPWFNTKLLTALIDIVPYMPAAKSYVDIYTAFIDYGYENCRTANNLFYEGWVSNPGDQGRYGNLLNQAAVIESYAAIARYKTTQQ